MNEAAFSARLRELRERAGMTREELAGRARLRVTVVRDLEQGHRSSPSWRVAIALATALGVSLDDLASPPSEEVVTPGPGRPRLEREPPPPPRKRGRPRKDGAR